MKDAAWRMIASHSVTDARGTLSVLDVPSTLPFVAHRVFYIYDVPAGAKRGAHAHRTLHQCIVCMTGSMDVTLDNGTRRETFRMDDPANCLYVPPLTWTTQENLASGTTYFILASAPYDESDYLRVYDEFLSAARA